ncbi:cupin [Halodesulfovibrio sp.]|uniref:cupin n=1 Tax=Halodesulfovibrio sp. TaxID=1912772 RepID=UPI0025BAB2E9|nr:cupin [Halodesulfovibrio sp.]
MLKYSLMKNEVFHPEKVFEELVHESDELNITTLHIKAGYELPAKASDEAGEAMLVVLSGEGLLLGKHGVLDSLVRGDVILTDLRVPHGLRAEKDMCVLASYTPLMEACDKS